MGRRRAGLAALALAAAAGLAGPLAVAAEDKMLVTCGSALKLEHMPTRHRLHPQEVAWSQHSQRALVTALNSDASALSGGDYWTVHCGDPPAAGASGSGSSNGTASASSSKGGGGTGTSASTAPGAPIPHGARVRLQSAATKKWLMASAEHRSPMTSNDEVSGYDSEKGGPPEAKAVVWVVEWDGQGAALPPPEEGEDDAAGDADAKKKKAAEADKRKKDLAAAAKLASKQGFWGGSTIVRLKHASSGHWLSSYERARFGHPLTGQQEVSTATGRPGGQEQWRAAEGVYLPVEHGAVLGGGGGAEGGAKKDEL